MLDKINGEMRKRETIEKKTKTLKKRFIVMDVKINIRKIYRILNP